jgi:hypothetical protein
MRYCPTASRRDFLKRSATVAGGMVLAGGLNIARTSHAQGSAVPRPNADGDYPIPIPGVYEPP